MQDFIDEVKDTAKKLDAKKTKAQLLTKEEMELQFLISLLCEEGNVQSENRK